jgi:hypothetical protein
MPDGESSISNAISQVSLDQEVEEEEAAEYGSMLPRAPESCSSESSEISNDSDEDIELEVPLTPSPPEPISNEERAIVANICGAIIRKKIMNKPDKSCPDCLSILQSTHTIHNVDHDLIHLRDFKEGALVRPSPAIIQLCCDFEEHFLAFSNVCLPHPHPRSVIIDSFLSHYDIPAVLCCNHHHSLVPSFLSHYCNIRIFHWVKLFNRNLKKGKKGSQLTKDRRLNM